MKVDILKLSNFAITPIKGTEDSAGLDLCSVGDVSISLNSIKLIKMDIGFKIPPGYFGKIYARSSLPVRCTEIDARYRGSIIVLFFNFSKGSRSWKG